MKFLRTCYNALNIRINSDNKTTAYEGPCYFLKLYWPKCSEVSSEYSKTTKFWSVTKKILLKLYKEGFPEYKEFIQNLHSRTFGE